MTELICTSEIFKKLKLREPLRSHIIFVIVLRDIIGLEIFLLSFSQL